MKTDQSQPHDPTENWLRQTLNGHQPEAPADAWQRLAPHLPQRKRRRPLVLWLSSIAFGTIAAIALFYVGMPAAPPVSVEEALPAAQVLTNNSLNAFQGTEAVVATEKNTIPPPTFSKQDFSIKNTPTAAAQFRKSANLTLPVLTQKSGATSIGEPVFSGKVTPAFGEKPAPWHTQPALEKLPGKFFASLVLSETSPPGFQISTVPVLSKKARKSRFMVEIEAAPMLLVQKTIAEMPGGLTFSERHNNPGKGWQVGVSIAVEMRKNWRFASGIQHLQQTHDATHLATLKLADGVCLNPYDPGLKEYEFQYTLVSGGGHSNLTLRLQQQDIHSTPRDEPFTLDMKTVYRSNTWRIPLTIERQFGVGKWHGFVRGGTILDFGEKSSVQVSHFTEACQELCFHGGYTPVAQLSSESQTAIGWLAGAGIERRISHRAALRFEPFVVGQKGSIQGGLSLGMLFSN